MIVFTTFVVKEGLRERLKDFVDSIQGAESIFLVRSDMVAMSFRLQDIEKQINDMAMTSPSGDPENPVTYAFHSVEQTVQIQQNIQALIEAIAALADKIPEEHYESRIENLRKQMEVVAAAASDENDMIDEAARGIDDPKNFRQRSHSVSRLRRKTEELSMSTHTLAAEILKGADAHRVFDERRYKRYTWIGYMLYVIGWTVSFSAQLFNKEQEGAVLVEG